MRGLWLAVLASGCAAHVNADVLSWNFSARPPPGTIVVMPAITVAEAPVVDLGSYVGVPLPYAQEQARRARTNELLAVPDAVGLGLPGAVNAAVAADWNGALVAGHWPLGGEERVRGALEKRGDVEAAVASVARAVGAEAVLVTWVSRLDGAPITALGFPGEVIDTEGGPVVVDPGLEPYVVTATVGVDLTTRDGEVLVRYQDTFHAILTANHGPEAVGRDLARDLAAEVAKVWAGDPRLIAAEGR